MSNAGRLAGKVVLLAGEFGPFGPGGKDGVVSNDWAIALECAQEGASVVIADREADMAKKVVAGLREAGHRAVPIACDVASEKDCEAAVAAAVRSFGALHLLVNNVGHADLKTIDSISAEEFAHAMRLNIVGQFMLAKRALPEIAKAGGGAVVMISSLSALRTGGAGIGYETSKAALLALTRNIALSAAPSRIRVNAVLPGMLNSAAFRSLAGDQVSAFAARVPLGRLGDPSELAKSIVFLLSEDASFITGTGLLVDGGMAGPL